MAKHDKSMLTEVAEGVRGRIENLLDYYEENKEQDFGVEKVTRREARRRFLAMPTEGRREIIAQQGLAKTLELFTERGR